MARSRSGHKFFSHSPHGLRDNRHRDDLEPVQPGRIGEVSECRHAISEEDHRYGGWPGNAEPCGEGSEQAGSQNTDADADLTARRSREKLAERNDVGVGQLVQPASPLDKLGPEIAEMRDRAAERSQSQAKKDAQHLGR